MVVKLTLMFAKEHGAKALQIYGDSLMVIQSMMGKCLLENFTLRTIYDETQEMKENFTTLSYRHACIQGRGC